MKQLEELLAKLETAEASAFVSFKGLLSTNEEIARAAKALKTSPIHGVRLRGCCISDQGAAALAAAILDNPTLQVLELPNNCIGRAGAEALREALKAPMCSLQALDLSGKDREVYIVHTQRKRALIACPCLRRGRACRDVLHAVFAV
jgi:hypothetical protein